MKGQSRQVNARARTRRSQRLPLRVPVLVYEPGTDKRFLLEETCTMTVNKHGGVIALGARVGPGQRLVLTNKNTRECKECRVVYVGPSQLGKKLVGIEFTQPAPDFWNISFPPPGAKPIPE